MSNFHRRSARSRERAERGEKIPPFATARAMTEEEKARSKRELQEAKKTALDVKKKVTEGRGIMAAENPKAQKLAQEMKKRKAQAAIRDELKTGRGNTYDENPGLRSDMQIQKSPRINAKKRKEGQRSIRDNGRTTLRDVHEKPVGAPNLRTEKILNKKRKK